MGGGKREKRVKKRQMEDVCGARKRKTEGGGERDEQNEAWNVRKRERAKELVWPGREGGSGEREREREREKCER